MCSSDLFFSIFKTFIINPAILTATKTIRYISIQSYTLSPLFMPLAFTVHLMLLSSEVDRTRREVVPLHLYFGEKIIQFQGPIRYATENGFEKRCKLDGKVPRGTTSRIHFGSIVVIVSVSVDMIYMATDMILILVRHGVEVGRRHW